MSAYISTTIADYDVEGEGETIDDALEAIAKQCEATADGLVRTTDELRKAAERFRRMREVEK